MPDYEIVKNMPIPLSRGGQYNVGNSFQNAVESLDVAATVIRPFNGRCSSAAYARSCVSRCKAKFPARNFTTRTWVNAEGEKCIGVWRLADTPPASLQAAAE